MTRQTDYQIALALLGLFTALYWATFGGHTYSPDEEMLYYVTEGIVERGSFVVPVATETTSLSAGARGVDGNNYAITGPLQSVLVIPLYLVGRLISTTFAPAFKPYWTRFFVCLFNGLVGGATVALMYLAGRKFGYRYLTALFLSFALGLATFFHVYARTFFSEPLVTFWLLLAVYAAFSYRTSPDLKYGVLLGLALGLSVATKPQSVIAGPVFAVYILAVAFEDYTEWRTRLSWLAKTALFGVIGALLPVSLVFAYNYVRFRNPLETGYTAILPGSYFRGTGLEAIYGFLFSPGKSFFLYAPPTVLGLLGTKTLFRRYRLETGLLWLLSLIHLIFYSFFFLIWFGGGCWGPRYLTYIIPSVLLPAGAFLESGQTRRCLRIGAAFLLFALGLFVQTGAILTNFNSYYNLDFGPHHSLYGVGWDSILFNPKYSPVIGHWRLWRTRYQEWQQYHRALSEFGHNQYTFKGSFYGTEVPALAPYGGWTGGPIVLQINTIPKESLELSVVYSRPLQEGIPQDELVFWLNGEQVRSTTIHLDTGTSGRHEARLSVNSNKILKNPIMVEFTTSLWSPVDVGISGDARQLGVFIERISVRVDGIELPFGGELPFFDPIPVSTSRPWDGYSSWWFWRTDLPHLVDTWWWYVSVVGLPYHQVQRVQLIGIGVISLIGLVSLCRLAKEFCRVLREK